MLSQNPYFVRIVKVYPKGLLSKSSFAKFTLSNLTDTMVLQSKVAWTIVFMNGKKTSVPDPNIFQYT